MIKQAILKVKKSHKILKTGVMGQSRKAGVFHFIMNKKYKRMIKIMLKRENSSKKRKPKEKWFLYILKCSDGSFYTGITKDMERRLKMHNDGKASKYTRTRGPVELVYRENCKTHARALARECEIKTFSRIQKQELIKESTE